MAEYIEREAALKVLRGKAVAKYPSTFYMGLFAAANEVGEIPAADVVEVVRCKDCKHQEDCMKQLVFWVRDHVLEQNVYQYHKIDFCSYGERRDSDD